MGKVKMKDVKVDFVRHQDPTRLQSSDNAMQTRF